MRCCLAPPFVSYGCSVCEHRIVSLSSKYLYYTCTCVVQNDQIYEILYQLDKKDSAIMAVMLTYFALQAAAFNIVCVSCNVRMTCTGRMCMIKLNVYRHSGVNKPHAHAHVRIHVHIRMYQGCTVCLKVVYHERVIAFRAVPPRCTLQP